MRLTIILAVALLLMGVVLQANAAPQLTLGSPTIMQGGTGSLTLSIYGGTEPYAGVNAKILLPQGITVTGVSEGDLPDGFTTDYYQLSDSNEVTVIAYSRDKTFSSDGVLFNLNIKADNNAEAKTCDVDFEAVNSNPLINSNALSNADGSESLIPATQPGKITISQASSEEDRGDVNGDKEINLTDAVLALKVACGMKPAGINIGADINKDGKIGLQEAVFIIQKVSEVR